MINTMVPKSLCFSVTRLSLTMYVVEREEANPAHLYIEVLLYFIVKFIVNFHLRSLLLSLILPLS